MTRRGSWLSAILLVASVWPVPVEAQLDCAPCHDELELLRQHVATLEEARALRVSPEDLGASAHAGVECSECHAEHTRFPHPIDAAVEPCASCHAPAEAAWSAGIHASDGNADCEACHGVHDVRTAEQLASEVGMIDMREACGDCHVEQRMVAVDPHADSVSCSDCHEPHATLPVTAEASRAHVLNQAETCGSCHDSISVMWSDDAHAGAVPLLARPGVEHLDGATGSDPPSCAACHVAHADPTEHDSGLEDGISLRCAGCHDDYAETFADSYHGQAGALGSRAVATCSDCHSAHEVHPADDIRSTVSEARLLDTCRECHMEATAGFTAFQPHADHHDRDKYPHVYWSYRIMTGLLVCVFTFFGVHSALWLARSAIDRSEPVRGELDADA